MRKREPCRHRRIGFGLTVIGAAMVLTVMLPFWFWWFLLGALFFTGGLWLLKR